MRQAVRVKISDSDKSNNPVMIAPTILVVTNVNARSIAEKRIVPNMLSVSNGRVWHMQKGVSLRERYATTARRTGRETTPMPKATHKNAVPIVSVPVMRKNAETIPMIRLAATAKTVQVGLLQ